jgi:hypothetical protein
VIHNYTIECPNCDGTGLWFDERKAWRCKRCKASWCEVQIYRILRPGPHLVGACFIPGAEPFDFYRDLAIERLDPSLR